MDYDQLEEQYYILSQKVKDLDKENNALQQRNADLEGQNIILENKLAREEKKNEHLVESVQEESLKTINLKARIEKLDDDLRYAQQETKFNKYSFFDDDLVAQQTKRNNQQFFGAQLPKHSIHQPMDSLSYPHAPTSVVLQATDIFGFYQEMDPRQYSKLFHVYAKLGSDKVARYSQSTMLDLQRPEDFGVVLNQMTDGLRKVIIDEWHKSNP